MTYQQALDFLYPLHRFGIRPGLERVLALLEFLGSPHERLGRIIHVAGTNGKGTVSSATASIFQEQGEKTALYTSPHLIDFTERMRINGEPISPDRVAGYCQRLEGLVRSLGATFFEVTTAIAFAWFADEGVTVSVIETGLGGRLDATNVVHPDHCIITTIGLEHTEWLGATLAGIAREKAAIIKPGSKVYTAITDQEAMVPVLEQVTEAGVSLAIAGQTCRIKVHDVGPQELVLDIATRKGICHALHAPLCGRFHADNLALAVMVAEDAGIGSSTIAAGIAALRRTGYRARLELIGSAPSIMLDVSHNPQGIRAMVATLLEFRHQYERIFILLGLVSDKDAGAIVHELARLADTFVTVPLATERSLEPDRLAGFCRSEGVAVTDYSSAGEGFDYLHRQASPGDLILVTGSFYLAGEILEATQV